MSSQGKLRRSGTDYGPAPDFGYFEVGARDEKKADDGALKELIGDA